MNILKTICRVNVTMATMLIILTVTMLACTSVSSDKLKEEFKNPPGTSYPGVYWYFMDGNLNREEMTKDLESMKEAGINKLIFLEVGIGVPRGSVDFMSEEWQDLYVHAVREAERLGIRISLGAGPGWCGSGGPWVKPEESMKHLVFSETEITGNKKTDIILPVPEQRSTPWHRMKDPYYEDVAAYAIPNSAKSVIEDINEKALYERYPISSHPNVKTHLPAPAEFNSTGESIILDQEEIINISKYLQDDGHLVWEAPKGNWTIIRMGVRITGASSRPAPRPVIGLESNKLDSTAFKNHLANYTDILLEKTEPRKRGVGWTGFHIDSWESGSQNWTEGFVEQFKNRRGYDPEPYFLAYTGRVIQSIETTERFLWDLRQTCKELLLENHVEFAKTYAHRNELVLTIEPYDMNPAGDLDLGNIADVIMAEFWSKRYGFNTSYAVTEATSISHISGKPIVGAEVFTSNREEVWQEYPWSMKDQSDWALALGVNRFVYHTFAHKPLGDEYRPGMSMGSYGVHWDRGQTWWPMVGSYHKYISRISHMMQQGQYVSDILYLTPEGSPVVFAPPVDAYKENGSIPDKKEYGFDGCSPKMLMDRADVKNGKIVFPGASSYEIMVLPNFETMTPELIEKIASLIGKGAKVIGIPPRKSPSLVDFPNCDTRVQTMADQLWGSKQIPADLKEISFEKGSLFWGGDLHNNNTDSTLYPSYESTVEILAQLKVKPDFESDSKNIRFGHRRTKDKDLYFIANRTDENQKTSCTFRASGEPELWSGIDGSTKKLMKYETVDGITSIELEFVPYESHFIVFNRNKAVDNETVNEGSNFETYKEIQTIEGAWDVAFNTKWGGPEKIQFDELHDWTQNRDRGIKYYSGIATYSKTFYLEQSKKEKYYLDLGIVHDLARVKLNGQELGVVWCAPWHIEISHALKAGENKLEIEVANRWVNRLIGDSREPDANIRTVKFDNGLLSGEEYSTGRYTFTIVKDISEEMTPSGLIGPVTIKMHCNNTRNASSKNNSSGQELTELKNQLASGWNTWDTRSVLTHVLLPEALALDLKLKDHKSGEVLEDALVGRGTYGSKEHVTPGPHAYDGSYTELEVEWQNIHVRVQSATKNDELYLLISPIEASGEDSLVIIPQILWDREGEINIDRNLLSAHTPHGSTKVFVNGDRWKAGTESIRVSLGHGIAISSGSSKSLEDVEVVISRAKKDLENGRSKFQKTPDLYNAMQTVLAWDLIYEPTHNRVIAPVSRRWNVGWEGWVLFEWDTYFAAYMFSLDNKELAYSNAIAMTEEITVQGFVPNFASARGSSEDRSEPPVGALMVKEIYKKHGDKWFLEEVYDELLTWNRWWTENRDVDGYLVWGSDPYEQGKWPEWLLKEIGNRQGAKWESGLDNSPLWDDAVFDSTTHRLMLADVGLISLYIQDCKSLAEISRVLGKTDNEKELKLRAEHYSRKLETLWNEEFGLYLNKDLVTGEFSYRLSPTLFYPLLAQVPDQEQAERMIKEHFYNPDEFWGEYIMPSIARNDAAYKDNLYWRGRIWAPMNFLVYLGTRNYELPGAEEALVEKSKNLLLKSWLEERHIYENYSAETGQGDDAGMSDKFYHWGALLGCIGIIDEGYVPSPQVPIGDVKKK